ncbi:Tat pathway signal sequence domain protein [Caulobacter vibrioides]|nr:Tat pathway signal sequence domain protein [Caulobacter vibrioides]
MLTRRALALSALALPLATTTAARAQAGERWRKADRLHTDDFTHGLADWTIEAEQPSRVTAANGILELDAPAGLTAWFKPRLSGPLLIEYQALAVYEGGRNDRISDLNAFWMATDVRSPDDLFASPRTGAFAGYDLLKTYYVGQGGNYNSSTRLRRYVGRPGDRPMLPQHDLKDARALLQPNRWVAVQLVAYDGLVQYWADGRKLFELRDQDPYASGWFGLRTTWSRLRFKDFSVWRLTGA